ncbi:MAG TPA: hypothetical protein VLB29_14430 [Nocardioidaceae bacterium]|nr:hypothetical protein [Nocardioidaceae bacterium]
MTSTSKRLATVLASAVLLLAGMPATAHAAAVDDYARYDGQTTCASEVLPGTDFLLRLLVRTHPGTSYTSTLRACSGDSVSEHKDGRALDWGVDADNPQQKAMAEAWLEKIFATDKQGNPDALARRMGIMYVIWDDHIYRAYDGFEQKPYEPCDRPRNCSKTLRHRDHVHVSLSRAGAAAQTTFYRARNVPSVPVLYPGTRQLDPYSTAEATFTVPATGRTFTTDFKLKAGETYRIVADGLVRTGAGSRIADAACRWTRDGWTLAGMLRVGGTNPWPATCSDSHTYEASYTPGTTDFLKLRVAENTPRDAEGSLTFSILRSDIGARTVASHRVAGTAEPRAVRRSGLRARALVSEEVTVRAASPRGALTGRALRRKARYRVVVTGKALSGSTVFDGRCVKYAQAWRPEHTLDLTNPSADHLSLFIQGVRVTLRVAGASRPCNGKAHRYVGVFKPVVNGRARVKIWDPYTYADNTGTLTVVLRRR